MILQLPRFRPNGAKLDFALEDEESVLLPTTQNSGVEISWKLYERWGYLLHTGNTPISGHYQFYDAPRLLFDDGVRPRSWNFTAELAKRAYCVVLFWPRLDSKLADDWEICEFPATEGTPKECGADCYSVHTPDILPDRHFGYVRWHPARWLA